MQNEMEGLGCDYDARHSFVAHVYDIHGMKQTHKEIEAIVKGKTAQSHPMYTDLPIKLDEAGCVRSMSA